MRGLISSYGGVPSPVFLAFGAAGPSIAFTGDSITANAFATAATFNQWCDNGFVVWGMGTNKSIAYMKPNGMKALSGTLSSDLASQVAAANLLNADILSIETGTNSIAASISGASIVNDIKAAIALSNAKLIIVNTILPRYGSSAFTVPMETERGNANAGIIGLASYRVLICDANLAGLVSGDFVFSGGDQGVHPNQNGSYKLGKQWGATLNTRMNGLLSDLEGLFSASGIFNPNNGLTGSGGTVSAPATGVCANNYTVSGNPSGVTTVYSKGVGDKQVVTLGGSYTGAGEQLCGAFAFNFSTVGLNVGDFFEGIFEGIVLTDFSSNVTTFDYQAAIFDTGFAQIAMSFGFALVATGQFPWKVADGVFTMRTPPFKVPAGNAPANIASSFGLLCAAGSAVPTSGALQVNNMAIRKVA